MAINGPPWPPQGGSNERDNHLRPLYSQRLKMRIQKSERLNRNVLEINLEKEQNAEQIEETMIAKLFDKVGITMVQLEGFQLVPKRMPRKVYVWFKEGVDIHQFCKDECYRLAAGVKTGTIKPMDRKEVEVTIKGLNLNTPDTMVMEYLNLFGKVVKNVAVYLKNRDGPFEGLKNGDRKYMMDFTGGRNLGTYHLVDGANVHISYTGQRRTCARCHKTPGSCLGGGLAKNCEAKTGPKISLVEHMKELWEEIGFKPAEFSMENDEDDNNENVEIRENQGFTPPYKSNPKLSNENREQLTGVSVRNLPLDIEGEQVQTFLESHGLPPAHTNIKVNKLKYSTTVDAEELTAATCIAIIDDIDGTIAFDRKIYCKGIKNISNNAEDIHGEQDQNTTLPANLLQQQLVTHSGKPPATANTPAQPPSTTSQN